MKKQSFLYLLAALLLCLVFETKASAQRSRRADSTINFFVGSWGPFEHGGPKRDDTTKERFGSIQDVISQDLRYINLPADLGFNIENRNFWDYPTDRPASPDSVLGGAREDSLDVLMLEPLQLMRAFEHAHYIRYEFERHTMQSAPTEYPGFLNHQPGLVGTNQDSPGSTYPAFLRGSVRAADTAFNSVVLDDSDSPGVFADSMWHHRIFEGPYDSNVDSIEKTFISNRIQCKMLMRIRVKVTDTIGSQPILFVVTRTERDRGNQVKTVAVDTVKVDAQFSHIGSDFDTIDIRFIRNDTTTRLHFRFSWPKQAYAIFDYMELMTAHVNTSDSQKYVHVDDHTFGSDRIFDGWASAFSGEDFHTDNLTNLQTLVNTFVARYKGHINYIHVGDEFGLAYSLSLKRFAKLVRDASDSMIEVATVTTDSGSWLGKSLPDLHDYNFEGVRRGWLDPDKYADIKMLFLDPYVFSNYVPLPKRVALPENAIDSFRRWQDRFLPTDKYFDNGLSYPKAWHYYNRDSLLLITQYICLDNYLHAHRYARRWVERQNNNSRFGIAWQGGAHPEVERQVDLDTSNPQPDVYWLKFNSLRPPTGPEMKVTGHLTASTGGHGLLIYFLRNQAHGVAGPNGGIMTYGGLHSSMYDSVTVNYGDTSSSGKIWTGYKERYDAVKNLVPILIKYGTTLLHSKRIGDWRAYEMVLADSATRASLPFVDTSIRSLDDSMRRDAYSPVRSILDSIHYTWPLRPFVADTSNRTFVHLSLWVDTLAGRSDTMLYIINMRTDDSYKPNSDTVSTIDRRMITIQLRNREFLITDVLDTSETRSLDRGIIWTPYVGPDDSLRVLLSPGEGVLVRLDTAYVDPMAQMRVGINYPKGGSDFNDHGRIVFDKPVEGVRDRISDLSIPSTRHSYIGIKDADTVSMWQDSLLYRSVHAQRQGRWRQQNWTTGNDADISFKYQQTVLPSPDRQRQTSKDSIAYNVVIKTEFEDGSPAGKIKFFDPFFVDSTTLQNTFGDTGKTAPFLPHSNPPIGTIPGGHHETYGGVFRAQNPIRDLDTSLKIPIYSIDAYTTIRGIGAPYSSDSIPEAFDWSFLEWHKTDTVHPNDPSPWINDTIARKVDVIFMKDSAQYIARYKRHMAAYPSNGGLDSGFCCNNQRKLFYLGMNSLHEKHYRLVYGSKGRIYTAEGWQTGTQNHDSYWLPERLLSPWLNSSGVPDTIYQNPSMSYLSLSSIPYFHFVYQDPSLGIHMVHEWRDSIFNHFMVSDSTGSSFALPAINSTTINTSWPVDAVAWVGSNGDGTPNGIHIRGILGLAGSNYHYLSNEIVIGDSSARFPTIWVDSCYQCNLDSSKIKFWVAWQQDTTINIIPIPPFVRTDIFSAAFEIQIDSGVRIVSIPGLSNWVDVSMPIKPGSGTNRRPCIAGMRLTDSTTDVRLKIAYESEPNLPIAPDCQGIQIVNNDNGNGWTSTIFLTACDTTDKYWKPSIEVTRNQKLGDDTLIYRPDWYSLVHEQRNGTAVQHWAMDSLTNRTWGISTFLNLQDPQIAVTPNKIDSGLFRMGRVFNEAAPFWLSPGFTTLFKLGGVDTLWGYHAIHETDTNDLVLGYGYGELGFDDGGLTEFDLLDRYDYLAITSAQPKDYFMRSVNFTLPATCGFQWCPWIRPSHDSIYRANHDTTVFTLDFHDTTGTYRFTIDSILIFDSTIAHTASLREVDIERENNERGYVVFRRRANTFREQTATQQNIVSTTPFSGPAESEKRASRGLFYATDEMLPFAASPNPTTGEIEFTLILPTDGPVTLAIFDAFGKEVAEICKEKQLRDGKRTLRHDFSTFPQGSYFARVQFGNLVRILRVIVVR